MTETLRNPARWLALAALLVVGACAPGTDEAEPAAEPEAEPTPVVLGPADGADLPPADLARVADGDLAPDFSAVKLGGETVTLSQYRGEKNVILFFYRGFW